MSKKYLLFFIMLLFLTFSIQNCLTDSKKKLNDIKTADQNGFDETFHKTGWISDSKYRAVVFVITNDECKNSSLSEIEEKIRFEAYKNLQKELNPSFNRTTANQIKSMTDISGQMIKTGKGCDDSNVYFYDLEKKDLKSDFEKIKNLK